MTPSAGPLSFTKRVDTAATGHGAEGGGWVGERGGEAPSAGPLSFPKRVDTAATGHGAGGGEETRGTHTGVVWGLEGVKMEASGLSLSGFHGAWLRLLMKCGCVSLFTAMFA